jgi:3'-phosphoadenosine 5'-phosphosulfate sulfotransferase
MTSKDDRRKIDESLRLVAAFMKVKDGKARSEVIRLAELYAKFESAEMPFRFDVDW